MLPNELSKRFFEPFEVMAHNNLVSILSNALMIEKLDYCCLRFEVVSLNSTERGHKLEALAIIECVMHLKRRRLHMREALLEKCINC